MTIKNIIPELMVEDVQTSIDFYKDYLNFEIENTALDEGLLTWAQVKNNEHRIMFYLKSEFKKEMPILKNKQIGSTIELYIKVDNIEEIYNKVKDNVKIIKELYSTSYGSKEFVMEDNSGYLIGLSE